MSLHRHWLSLAFKHVDLDRERARVELAPATALASDRYRRGMPGPGDRRGVDPLRETSTMTTFLEVLRLEGGGLTPPHTPPRVP